MEYRRRTGNGGYGGRSGGRSYGGSSYGGRSGRRSARGRGSGSGGALKAVILLFVAATVIYVICATPIGDGIIDKVFVPLFANVSGTHAPVPTYYAEFTNQPALSAQPTVGAETGSAEVTLPRIDIYMLQMGVFSTEENGAELQASLRALGAAGYSYFDGSNYRVIAAAYSDEESAKSVRSRLTGEGYDCTIYHISYDGAELLITAAKDRLLPVETAFALAHDMVEQLSETALDFDSSERSVEYGKTILAEMSTNAKNAAGAIKDAAETNSRLMCVYNYYSDIAGIIGNAMGHDETRIEFSSAMKRARIELSLRYMELLRQIGA